MAWYLGSIIIDRRKHLREVILRVDASGTTGNMKGTIEFQILGITYSVTGEWAASGSVPGRNASAFVLSGNNGAAAPNFVAAAGLMQGPGNAPESITINLIVSSSSAGDIKTWQEILNPI